MHCKALKLLSVVLFTKTIMQQQFITAGTFTIENTPWGTVQIVCIPDCKFLIDFYTGRKHKALL